jgi:hypothetical protein
MSTVVEESMCPDERLVALVQGGLDAEAQLALEQHVGSCLECTRELRLLRAELALFSARAELAPAPASGVWDQIAARTVGVAPPARVNQPARARRRAGWLAGTSLAAAAAVVAFLAVDRHMAPGHAQIRRLTDAGLAAMQPAPLHQSTARADAALDAADRDLDQAIAQLQEEYARRRVTLKPSRMRRYDEQFNAAFTAVEQARSVAGTDVSARRQLVRARARYLRSIQTVVLREGRS